MFFPISGLDFYAQDVFGEVAGSRGGHTGGTAIMDFATNILGDLSVLDGPIPSIFKLVVVLVSFSYMVMTGFDIYHQARKLDMGFGGQIMAFGYPAALFFTAILLLYLPNLGLLVNKAAIGSTSVLAYQQSEFSRDTVLGEEGALALQALGGFVMMYGYYAMFKSIAKLPSIVRARSSGGGNASYKGPVFMFLSGAILINIYAWADLVRSGVEKLFN